VRNSLPVIVQNTDFGGVVKMLLGEGAGMGQLEADKEKEK
jgi:hypothetical protein